MQELVYFCNLFLHHCRKFKSSWRIRNQQRRWQKPSRLKSNITGFYTNMTTHSFSFASISNPYTSFAKRLYAEYVYKLIRCWWRHRLKCTLKTLDSASWDRFARMQTFKAYLAWDWQRRTKLFGMRWIYFCLLAWNRTEVFWLLVSRKKRQTSLRQGWHK